MRFFSVLPLFALFLGTRATSHVSRQPAHGLDARAPILDLCVALNVNLEVPRVADGVLQAVGIVDACICLSALPVFLEADIVALAAVKIAGIDVVADILTGLIHDRWAKEPCSYPEHGVPACLPEHPHCGFTCTDGFTPSYDPRKCECKAPNVLCNGKCQASGPCASARASTEKKKRWIGSGVCAEKGPEWAACGVYGGRPHAWECVNTARDLESCGGCAIPLSPYTPVGQDCSAIVGVADVSCLYGECIVYRCQPGFEPAHDGRSCVRTYSQFDGAAEVPANAYGLEHVPLGRH